MRSIYAVSTVLVVALLFGCAPPARPEASTPSGGDTDSTWLALDESGFGTLHGVRVSAKSRGVCDPDSSTAAWEALGTLVTESGESAPLNPGSGYLAVIIRDSVGDIEYSRVVGMYYTADTAFTLRTDSGSVDTTVGVLGEAGSMLAPTVAFHQDDAALYLDAVELATVH